MKHLPYILVFLTVATIALAEKPEATYTEELPDAPDGAYWVIQFITNFQEKHYAVETITQMQQPDGTWKTAGYFIR